MNGALETLVFALPALAHSGALRSLPWWSAYNWDPIILFNLLMLGWLYQRGLRRLWAKASVGHPVGRRHAAAFYGGLLVVLVALVSPLDPLSDELASAHMVQHMLLMNVAAPLCVLGMPGLAFLWAFSAAWRGRLAEGWNRLEPLGRWRYVLWQPALAWLLYAAALWVWHLPVLYQAALRSRAVHEVQHLVFFIVSCLFWRVALDPIARGRLSPIVGVLYLFTTSLHASVLGVFMALSNAPWYTDYEGRTARWGLTILEDQQLAGLIMWMPACLIYALVAAALLALWLSRLAPTGRPEMRQGQVVLPAGGTGQPTLQN